MGFTIRPSDAVIMMGLDDGTAVLWHTDMWMHASEDAPEGRRKSHSHPGTVHGLARFLREHPPTSLLLSLALLDPEATLFWKDLGRPDARPDAHPDARPDVRFPAQGDGAPADRASVPDIPDVPADSAARADGSAAPGRSR